MQNHHHLYPYPQGKAGEGKREAGSNGRKSPADTAPAGGAPTKPNKSFVAAIPNAISAWRKVCSLVGLFD